MDISQIIDEMLNMLENSEVSVRRDSLGGAGSSLCNLKGKKVLFFDIDASPYDNAAVLASVVNKFVDTELIFIKPAIRQFLEQNRYTDPD